MECRMSLKLYFLYSHLDFFQENLGAYRKEHGEIFHQAIQQIEKRYQGRWDSAMQSRNQLGTPGGAKSFLRGPSYLNYVQ